MGGSGNSINLANYAGALTAQGYKDGAVGYLDAPHTTSGVALSSGSDGDFFFIKNTGFYYSSATVLGAVSTDCVLVAIRIPAQDAASEAGWEKSDGTSQIHFIEIAWLKPGQAIVLPLAVNSITNFGMTTGKRFGENDDDLTALNQNIGGGTDQESAVLTVRTYQSDGTAASNGNAVEFLMVT